MTADIPDSIEAIVVVARVLGGRTARVRLSNGREVFGYAGKSAAIKDLAEGDAWRARLFVADFSRAELLAPADVDQIAKSI